MVSPEFKNKNKWYWPLLFALFILIAFQLRFIFRSLDDNRLTSWQWVFHGVNVTHIILLLVIGIIAAYTLSRASFPERSPVLFLFAFSFLASAAFWGEPEVIVDSSRYFTQAKHLEMYGMHYFIREWGHEINAWTDLPLLPFLYGIIFKTAGESRIAIQIFNSTLFAMTAVCTYLLGKDLWNEGTGFIAGLLVMGIPYLLTQTPLMLVDIGSMFFLTLSVLAFTRALKGGGVWILLASTAIFCAVFSKFSTWMMLSVLGVIFLVFIIDRNPVPGFRKRLLVRVMTVALIALLPIVPLILYKYDVITGQINLLVTYQKPALKGWSESFASTYLFQIHPFITIAAIFSLYSAIRKKDIRYLIISWLTILMVLLWVKRIRYILPIFPMVALMAAYGFQSIRDGALRRFCSFAIVSASLVVGIFVFLPFLKHMGPVNLENAGRYLDSLEVSSIEVLTPPSKSFSINPAVSVPILDLYTRKDLYYRYEEAELPEKVKTSPMRFTWTYKNPSYYRDAERHDKQEVTPIVVITSEHREKLSGQIKSRTQGYHKAAEFRDTTGVFRYSPDVLIFTPSDG